MTNSNLEKIKARAGSFLHRCGVSANALTVLGILFSFAAAFFIYRKEFVWAGLMLLTAGFLDLLDGAVARAAGKAGSFGGILDSSLDRYGDGIVLGAIVIHFADWGEALYAGLALSALLGSFAVSYVRARAEREVKGCRVGFWERGERLTYVALGLLAGNVEASLWVLGIFTHGTVFQRLFLSRRLLAGEAGGAEPGGRGSISYKLQVFFWLMVLMMWRPAS